MSAILLVLVYELAIQRQHASLNLVNPDISADCLHTPPKGLISKFADLYQDLCMLMNTCAYSTCQNYGVSALVTNHGPTISKHDVAPAVPVSNSKLQIHDPG